MDAESLGSSFGPCEANADAMGWWSGLSVAAIQALRNKRTKRTTHRQEETLNEGRIRTR